MYKVYIIDPLLCMNRGASDVAVVGADRPLDFYDQFILYAGDFYMRGPGKGHEYYLSWT